MHIAAVRNTQIVHALRQMIALRWLLIVMLAVMGVWRHLSYHPYTFTSLMVWGLCVAIPLFYNCIYRWILHRSPLTSRVAYILCIVQVGLDIALFTVIAYIAGASESLAFLLYIYAILEASIVLTEVFVIITSLVSVMSYCAVIFFDFYRIIPHINRFAQSSELSLRGDIVAANTFSVAICFVFVGVFSVMISRLMQERTAQLMIEQDTIKSLFQSLVDGILLINKDRSVILVNPPARELLQVKSDELVVLDLKRFPPEYTQMITLLRDQTPHKLLDQEVSIDIIGQRLHLVIDSVPVRSQAGEIVYWLKVIHDVTREKQLEEVKSDFISTAAHQLRTPLAALKWFFKMMFDGDAGTVTEAQRHLLDQAYQRNEEVIETVNHLLNVSEIEEGRLHYVFTRTNAGKIIQEIAEHADNDSEHTGVRVRYVQGSSKLPFIDVDIHKFRMAIQNVVDNAVKYSRKGSDVEVRVTTQENQYVIEIEDHGIGIPRDEYDRIFMKFFRGGYAKEKETVGSGLGLYIVKNIISEHHGMIRFHSEQGKGTTFTITMPIPSDKKTIDSMAA